MEGFQRNRSKTLLSGKKLTLFETLSARRGDSVLLEGMSTTNRAN